MKNKQSKPLTVKDYFLTKESFLVTNCTTTKYLLKTQPVPNDLEPYYNSDIYISHTDANQTLFEKAYQIAKKFNLKHKYQQLTRYKKSGKILDYGCGVGDFLKLCQQNNWMVEGVEPNPKANTIAQRKLAGKIHASANLKAFPDASFDAITLWHVLEHVPDIKALQTQLLRVLKPDGVLIIAVPNYDAYDAKYYQQHWAAWDVPRHLWHFNPKAMQQFFINTGFTIVASKPMWLDAFYVSILSAKYTKSIFQQFISPVVALISNVMAIFTNNSSSVVYFIKKTP